MIRHATEAPRPLKQFNPAVPDGLQQIVGVMLAKDPAQRYPTPDRAAQALHGFLTAGGEPAATPEADPRMRSYLNWLETEDRKPSPAASPEPATLAFGPVRTGEPSAKVTAAAVRPAKARKHSSKRHSRKEKGRSPSAPVVPPIAQPIQVELVPAGPMPPPPRSPYRLSRRDFVMFGAGVVSTGAAIFLGWAMARLLHQQEPLPESSDAADQKPAD
jgi:serine/threonine-protein kinase